VPRRPAKQAGWRGPEYPGEFPTLGYAVADLIQATCVIPDGDRAGDPYLLTDEQLRFLLWHYRIDPTVKRDKQRRWLLPFVYFRGSQLVRPQKWGKGPFSAAIVIAECHPEAPVLFDGWDANGEPVGRPWATPWWQITAVSEDQTDNVWRALQPMIELGALRADIPDTGQTRINLPGGGRIEPVTSSARSRLGQRITGSIQDESHSWTHRNGGRTLADNQRRNLGGMGGRWIETTNAWDPTEKSVAQETSEAREPGVYFDDADPGVGSVRNKAERRRMLRRVYGDSAAGKTSEATSAAGWVDLDRIDAEIVALLERDPAQAERFFLNRKHAGESAAFDPTKITKARRAIEVPNRSLVVIGVDGARFVDALGMVATVVEGPETGDGPADHQWPLGIWERPDSAPDDYEHPLDEIDGAMIEAFELYDVWRVYVDPQYIEHLLERWQGRWGNKRVLPWLMSRPRQSAWLVRNYTEAWGAGDVTHNGDELFVQHLKNARKQKVQVYDDKHRQMHTISKESPDSRLKIDGAAAGGLSWEARGDCIAAGKPRTTSRAAAFL
jgi:hypothetical protein